jgi:hypothetical protein
MENAFGASHRQESSFPSPSSRPAWQGSKKGVLLPDNVFDGHLTGHLWDRGGEYSVEQKEKPCCPHHGFFGGNRVVIMKRRKTE